MAPIACFHPQPAWQFGGLAKLIKAGRPLPVEFPCGRCVGCRGSRQRAWALRITHEAQVNQPSCFITLTYDDARCPYSLNPLDLKLFLRRVSDRCGPTRYFAVGEYGSLSGRPHYHAILFGRTFSRSHVVSGDGPTSVYASPDLQELWSYGFSSISSVTLDSARYVAKYTLKSSRSTSLTVCDTSTGELHSIQPEFAHMSRRPGIGRAWFDKFSSDVYAARDGVCLPGGTVVPPPRYYDKLLEDVDPALRALKRLSRVNVAYLRRADATPQRLLVREICAIAALKRRKDSRL